MIDIHFLDVGQGNMVVCIFSDGKILTYDCNITQENETKVFSYLKRIMPKNDIDVFVNSHRDADHMRGIKTLHRSYHINELWDSGVSGNTGTPEYEEYMDFRRNIVGRVCEVKSNQHWSKDINVKILNGKRENLTDQNSQSVVLHINNNGASVLLTGDTDAKVWKDYIMPESETKLPSSFLFASHHGSITFFDDPRDDNNYYTTHIKKICPSMTVISVGANSHGLPNDKALKLYKKYSKGSSNSALKIFRTDKYGNIRLELKDDGNSTLHH